MDLREVKKEVYELPDIRKALDNFQKSWIQPENGNNSHLPFLKSLDAETKQNLNQKVSSLQETFQKVRSAQVIHERLHQHSHALVELKLTTFNGDKKKAKMLTSQLTCGENSISQTISQIKSFQDHLFHLSQQYEEVSQLLDKKLSLDEMLFYLELPHRRYLQGLLKISHDHQKIARDLGRYFITIAQEVQARKGMQR